MGRLKHVAATPFNRRKRSFAALHFPTTLAFARLILRTVLTLLLAKSVRFSKCPTTVPLLIAAKIFLVVDEGATLIRPVETPGIPAAIARSVLSTLTAFSPLIASCRTPVIICFFYCFFTKK
jgi:hypothetical protein